MAERCLREPLNKTGPSSEWPRCSSSRGESHATASHGEDALRRNRTARAQGAGAWLVQWGLPSDRSWKLRFFDQSNDGIRVDVFLLALRVDG